MFIIIQVKMFSFLFVFMKIKFLNPNSNLTKYVFRLKKVVDNPLPLFSTKNQHQIQLLLRCRTLYKAPNQQSKRVTISNEIRSLDSRNEFIGLPSLLMLLAKKLFILGSWHNRRIPGRSQMSNLGNFGDLIHFSRKKVDMKISNFWSNEIFFYSRRMIIDYLPRVFP